MVLTSVHFVMHLKETTHFLSNSIPGCCHHVISLPCFEVTIIDDTLQIIDLFLQCFYSVIADDLTCLPFSSGLFPDNSPYIFRSEHFSAEGRPDESLRWDVFRFLSLNNTVRVVRKLQDTACFTRTASSIVRWCSWFPRNSCRVGSWSPRRSSASSTGDLGPGRPAVGVLLSGELTWRIPLPFLGECLLGYPASVSMGARGPSWVETSGKGLHDLVLCPFTPNEILFCHPSLRF